MKKVRMKPSLWKAVAMRGMKILNIIIGAGLFILCWREFYRETYAPISWEAGTAIVLFYVVLLILLKRIYNAYDVGGSRVSELIYSLCLADVIADGILYVVFATGIVFKVSASFFTTLTWYSIGFSSVIKYKFNSFS